MLSFSLFSSCRALNGWLTGYNYRRIFYWQSNLDNAQDILTIDYILNQTQPDFEDLRVTLNDGETLLPIWNYSTVNMDYCAFWCLFPTANTTYYLYWGNPTAESVWNKTAVFNAVIGNVVGSWLLNETQAADPALDYSGNGNDGSPSGTEIADSYFVGEKARQFNATNSDYIQVLDNAALRLTPNQTVSFWYKPTGTDSEAVVMKKYNNDLNNYGWACYCAVSGARLYVRGHAATGIYGSQTLNSWQHAIVLYVGAYAYIYINGTLVKEGSILTIDNSFLGNLRFGGATGIFYDGYLCNVNIYSDILNNSERTSLDNGYGDPTLSEGEILVRAWADSLIASWGETETYSTEYSNEEILGITIALIITFFSVALVFTIVKRKRND